MKDNFWLQYNLEFNHNINKFFNTYSKMDYFIKKHNIKDEQINFIRTRKKEK